MLLLLIIYEQLTQILEMFDVAKKVLAVTIWGAHDFVEPSIGSKPNCFHYVADVHPWQQTSLRLPV